MIEPLAFDHQRHRKIEASYQPPTASQFAAEEAGASGKIEHHLASGTDAESFESPVEFLWVTGPMTPVVGGGLTKIDLLAVITNLFNTPRGHQMPSSR